MSGANVGFDSAGANYLATEAARNPLAALWSGQRQIVHPAEARWRFGLAFT